jgi:hypothetical protein
MIEIDCIYQLIEKYPNITQEQIEQDICQK